MGSITLGQAAQWCGGKIDPKYADVAFFGANNDSRKIEPGQLFVALQGERDGHDFIPEVMGKGAVAFVVEKDVELVEGYTYIKVPDCRKALA